MTNFTRNIFAKRKHWSEPLLPYAVGALIAWCVVWLVILSFDGVGK